MRSTPDITTLCQFRINVYFIQLLIQRVRIIIYVGIDHLTWELKIKHNSFERHVSSYFNLFDMNDYFDFIHNLAM